MQSGAILRVLAWIIGFWLCGRAEFLKLSDLGPSCFYAVGKGGGYAGAAATLAVAWFGGGEGNGMAHSGIVSLPIWRRVLQGPLMRLVLLGAGAFLLMGWAQSWLEAYHDAPLTNLAIQIVLALAGIGLYIGYGRLIERRAVTELATPGLARE